MFPIWTADVENKRDDGVATGIDERFAAQVGLLNLKHKTRLFLATLLKEIVIVFVYDFLVLCFTKNFLFILRTPTSLPKK